MLESRRHFLDASEMNTEEAATFAVALGRLTAAIRQTVGAERVYTWASMAQFPHMHVWLMPWTADKPEGPAFLSAIETFKCTPEQAWQTAAELRASLRACGVPPDSLMSPWKTDGRPMKGGFQILTDAPRTQRQASGEES